MMDVPQHLVILDAAIARAEHWMTGEDLQEDALFAAAHEAMCGYERYLEHKLDAEYEDIARNAPWAL